MLSSTGVRSAATSHSPTWPERRRADVLWGGVASPSHANVDNSTATSDLESTWTSSAKTKGRHGVVGYEESMLSSAGVRTAATSHSSTWPERRRADVLSGGVASPSHANVDNSTATSDLESTRTSSAKTKGRHGVVGYGESMLSSAGVRTAPTSHSSTWPERRRADVLSGGVASPSHANVDSASATSDREQTLMNYAETNAQCAFVGYEESMFSSAGVRAAEPRTARRGPSGGAWACCGRCFEPLSRERGQRQCHVGYRVDTDKFR